MAAFHHELPGEMLYEDMMLCDGFPLSTILRFQAMELEPSDVIVASYPKTGTTLLQEIVWLIRNDVNVEVADKTLSVVRVPFIEYGLFDCVELFANLPHPRTMKTHVPYRFLAKTARELTNKIVYITRNPKDTLVSFYHFYRMNKSFNNFKGTWEDFFNYFMGNGAMLGYGNPIDHMKGYWLHRNDPNLHIVAYEQLIKNPRSTIQAIAHFLGKDLTAESLDTITRMTSFDVMKENPMTNMSQEPSDVFDFNISPFIRKGKIGDWKNYFTDEQNRIIDEMCAERLEGTNLTFIYE